MTQMAETCTLHEIRLRNPVSLWFCHLATYRAWCQKCCDSNPMKLWVWFPEGFGSLRVGSLRVGFLRMQHHGPYTRMLVGVKHITGIHIREGSSFSVVRIYKPRKLLYECLSSIMCHHGKEQIEYSRWLYISEW